MNSKPPSRFITSHALTLLALIFLGVSCTIGPNYSSPDASEQLGTHFSHASSKTSATAMRGPWWNSFGDVSLDPVMRKVLAGNQELAQARARIEASRAIARSQFAERYPTAILGGSYQRANFPNLSLPGTALQDASSNQITYSLPLDLSYEIDLWGRVRRGAEAASSQLSATMLDAENAKLSLTIEAARLTILHRSIAAEITTAQGSIHIQQRILTLTRPRQHEGLATSLEVTQQQSAIATTTADLYNLERDLQQTHHALATLCGLPPSELKLPNITREFPSTVPPIPSGLPADLLKRRADIAAAERRLRASSAEIGIAMAAALPGIRLTGQASTVSADVGKLLNAPSNFWSFGPSVSVPIFDGGRNQASLRLAEAQHREALATYRHSILIAVREVEDSLAAIRASQQEKSSRQLAVTAAVQALRTATDQHEAGTLPLADLLEIQTRHCLATRALTQSEAQHFYATFQLIKALGGGWKS